MINALVVFGTRPEAIKLAPVIAELQSRSGEFRTHICVTAQHRQMLDQVLDWFGIVPDSDLDLMEANPVVSGYKSSRLNWLENRSDFSWE